MDICTSKYEMTVIENIKFWKKLFSSSIKSKEIDAIINLLLLKDCKNTKVNYLSTGEIKKLELCRLVIEQKKLWILDDPYLGLDKFITTILNETLKSHIENGGMVILASHFSPQIMDIEDLQLESYANN